MTHNNKLEKVEQGFRVEESINREDLRNFIAKLYETDRGRFALVQRFGSTGSLESYLRLKVVLGNLENYIQLVIRNENGEVVGFGECIIYPEDPTTAGISRLIDPDFQGKGLGTFLAKELIRLTREKHPNVEKIISETFVPAAVASLKKLGFKHRWQDNGTSQMQSVMELGLNKV